MGKTEFVFDLGAILETRGEGYERTDTSWMLYRPDRLVFTYRAEGYYSLQSSSGAGENWISIPDV
jgi:hypothetical protein